MHFALFIEKIAPLFLCPNRVTCLGKWPGRTCCFLFFFKKNKRKRKRFMIFWNIYFKVWIFLCCKKKYINLVFRIPGFRCNVTNIHISKKHVFLCVAYGQYPNMFWTFLKKILEVSKMCFHTDFLNTTKIIFLYFLILQHVCKTPKGIGQYFKKYKKLILGGFSYIIHR